MSNFKAEMNSFDVGLCPSREAKFRGTQPRVIIVLAIVFLKI
jgi:hypothetical protein